LLQQNLHLGAPQTRLIVLQKVADMVQEWYRLVDEPSEDWYVKLQQLRPKKESLEQQMDGMQKFGHQQYQR
jgi:hypothetical protein